MRFIEMFKNNTKLYIMMAIIILLGTTGVTFALIINGFNDIAINTTTSIIDANISYDEGTNTAEVVNNGNMLPISDSLVTGPNVTDTRVLKVGFNVSGVNDNPDNTIYDIAMYFNSIDCALRTEDLKWRLYKNNNLLNEGNLSTTYDTMANNRLVLTNTQEDLTTSTDKYTFLLWISESCTGDITECDSSMDQSKYLNKSLNGTIKIELATGSKKVIERITAPEESCSYVETEIPVCNSLTYNGQEQLLVGTGDASLLSNRYNYKITPLSVVPIADSSNYTINNNVGVNAGSYPVILKLNEGYKWTDGSTNDKCIYCSISKKNMSITTNSQSIVYGENITSNISDITSEGLLSGNSITDVSLSSSIVEVGTGYISTNNIKITDTSGNDVTNNYNITKKNDGVLTITCSKTAEEPVVNSFDYTGSELVGVTDNGRFIEIKGNTKATEIGIYSVTATPYKNYCWSDGTTGEKTYTWSVLGNNLDIELNDKEVDYNGSAVTIDPPTIKDREGNTVTDIPVSYRYYSGETCSDTRLDSAPTNAGSYSVKAYTEATDDYQASESNCAKLTINKISGSITASSDSLSLTYPTAGTFTYTYTGDGTVTCSTGSSSIATCSVNTDTKTVTVTPTASGNTTVTVTLGDGVNYNGASDTVNVTILNTAKITILRNGTAYSGLTVTLRQNGTSKYSTSSYSSGVYTFNNVASGTYDIYVGSKDTEKDIVVSTTSTTTINFYTLTVNRSTAAGISSVTGGGTYISGQTANINAVVASGYTFNGWTVQTGNTPASTTSASTTITITSQTVLVARWKRTVTGTFHYYNGSTKTTATSQCTYTDSASNCTFTMPSEVLSSTGPNGSAYYGVSTSTSSSTITTTYKSSNKNYYAVYKGTLTATYTKENNNVSSIGKTTDSCESYKYYNGTSYISASCSITLPDITPISGYIVDGWYNSSGTKVGVPAGTISLSNNETFTAKVNMDLTSSDFSYDGTDSGSTCTDVTCALDELYEGINSPLKLGDYVLYTPTVTSYLTDTTYTGYSSSQTIKPNELTIWRVLNKNADGSIDIISEYVSSTNVYFKGQTGYLNLVGYLNVLAKKYESDVTLGSRCFGYNGQIEYLDSSLVSFPDPVVWTTSTMDNSNESIGGGDIKYEKDYNQLLTVLGTTKAYKEGANVGAAYWAASRYYDYTSASQHGWTGRLIVQNGNLGFSGMYYNAFLGFSDNGVFGSLRPIVTLKPGLQYTGEGTSGSPWEIVG